MTGSDETVVWPKRSIEMKLLAQQIRDYSTVGMNLFWQRQMIFAAAIGLSAFYYDIWLSITTFILIVLSEIYDYHLFRKISVWRGRSPKVARQFMWSIYLGTLLSSAVISYYAIAIALQQGPTTHFMSLFFLFAAALFAAMNNHHLMPVLIVRLAIYGVTFLFIPLWDIIRTGASIHSELWMQFFTVIFVLYFIIDCSRIFLGLYRTNLHQLEELRLEHENTKIAFRAKSEFLSTISHELRTPMTSIKGALDMTCAGALGEMPSNVQKVLLIAQKNSTRLTSIINEILDHQKFEAGKISFDLEKLDIKEIIESAVDMNQAYAARLKVELALGHLHEGVDVLADEKRLQQVMSNLLSNAAKFSHADGKVTISTELAPDRVRILVVDAGIGLSDADRVKVFDQFTQVDSSDQRAVGGTGLGMNISKRIVEGLGGVIDYRKNDDVGTTFFVDLPLEKGDTLVRGETVAFPVERALKHLRTKLSSAA